MSLTATYDYHVSANRNLGYSTAPIVGKNLGSTTATRKSRYSTKSKPSCWAAHKSVRISRDVVGRS